MRIIKRRSAFLTICVLFFALMLYMDFIAKYVPSYWWMIRDGVVLLMVILFAYGYPNRDEKR